MTLSTRVDARHGVADDAQVAARVRRSPVSARRFRRHRRAPAPAAPRRRQDRVDDLAVAGAPAEVAAQQCGDALGRRRRVLVEERLGGQQHAGGAEAALHGAVLDERLLERDGARPASPSPSTVRTARPSTSTARYVHALTGAPSTSTVHAPHTCEVARALGALEVEPVAQHVEQQRVRRRTSSATRTPVDGAGEARRRRCGHSGHPGLRPCGARGGQRERARRRTRASSRACSRREPWRSSSGSTDSAASAPSSPARRPTSSTSAPRERVLDATRRRSGRGPTQPTATRASPTRPGRAVGQERHRDAQRRPLVEAELHVGAGRPGGPRPERVRASGSRRRGAPSRRGRGRSRRAAARAARAPTRASRARRRARNERGEVAVRIGEGEVAADRADARARARWPRAGRRRPRAGSRARTSAERSTSRCVTRGADREQRRRATPMPRRPGTRLTSISRGAGSKPLFRRSSSSVPPAYRTAVARRARRSGRLASSTVSARWSAKGRSTLTRAPRRARGSPRRSSGGSRSAPAPRAGRL